MITKRQITVATPTGELVTLVEQVPGSTYTLTTNGVVWEAQEPEKAEWLLDAVQAMLISDKSGVY